MSTSPLDQAASTSRVRALAAEGLLDERAYTRAMIALGARPTAAVWRRFLELHALVLGVVLVVAGVFCFVAANWGAVPMSVKIGAALAAVGGCTAAGVRAGIDRIPGRAALLAAGLLVGPLLALVGQAYPSGAEIHELTGGWALLILPFCVAARFDEMWILWVALIDATIPLWWQAGHESSLGEDGGLKLLLLLAVLHGAAVVGWEIARLRGVAAAQGRRFPRVLGLATLVALTLPIFRMIVDEYRRSTPELTFAYGAALLGALAGIFLVYRTVVPDLSMLAAGAGAAATIVTTLAAMWIFSGMRGDGIGGVFLLGFLILVEAAAIGAWLRSWWRHPLHRGESEDRP